MALWIGGSYGWQMVAARVTAKAAARVQPPKQPPAELRSAGPAGRPAPLDVKAEMAGLYRGEAERAMEAQPADWPKAEVLLRRAVELGDATDRTAGELALSRDLRRLND
jgi:hypothetical protein